MSKFIVVSVYDSKAETFAEPKFFPNVATAIRAFKVATVQEGNLFNVHAEDYTLFELGSFDSESGMLAPLGTPKAIVRAVVVLAESRKEQN